MRVTLVFHLQHSFPTRRSSDLSPPIAFHSVGRTDYVSSTAAMDIEGNNLLIDDLSTPPTAADDPLLYKILQCSTIFMKTLLMM